MENKIEFNWEKYQSGKYDVVTRDGRKVEQLHMFECKSDYPLNGVIDNYIKIWDNNGKFLIDEESKEDLFLIPKEKEDHFADVGEMVIPELKGVLMEVSDDEDFKLSINREVVGKYKSRYLVEAHTGYVVYYKYARPINEVKECWVNVYESKLGLYCVGSYKTKDEALEYKNEYNGYIKTIKITNEKE